MLAPAISAILREQRALRGLSIQEIAERSGLAIEVVQQAEEDARVLSTAKLGRIATALQLDPDALVRGQRQSRADPDMYFRSFGGNAFHDDDRAFLADALQVARSLAAVSELLKQADVLGSGLQSKVQSRPVGIPPWRDGYVAAQEVRTALGMETEPISDLGQLFSANLTTPVEAVSLKSHWIAAVTVKDVSSRASLVAINSDRGLLDSLPLYVRVTLAHELAHVLLDEVPGSTPISVRIDTDDEKDPNEQRANAFAAEFLMPEKGLVALLGLPSYSYSFTEALDFVERARHHFCTTVGLTVRHLIYRGFIFRSQRLRDQLIEFASAQPQPHCPPTSLSLAAGRPRLTELVRLAHMRMLITEGRARELLGLTPWDDLPWGTDDDTISA